MHEKLLLPASFLLLSLALLIACAPAAAPTPTTTALPKAAATPNTAPAVKPTVASPAATPTTAAPAAKPTEPTKPAATTPIKSPIPETETAVRHYIVSLVPTVISRLQGGWLDPSPQGEEIISVLLQQIITEGHIDVIFDSTFFIMKAVTSNSGTKRIRVHGSSVNQLPPGELEVSLVHEATHLLPHQVNRTIKRMRIRDALPGNTDPMLSVNEAGRRNREDFKRYIALQVQNEIEASTNEFLYRWRIAQLVGAESVKAYLAQIARSASVPFIRVNYEGFALLTKPDGTFEEDAVRVILVLDSPGFSEAERRLIRRIAALEGKTSEDELAAWLKGWLKDPAYHQ